MLKIIIIIGQSASGKSTFVKKKFLKKTAELIEKPFAHTIDGGICLLGNYISDRRCVGTDMLSMSVLPKLIEFIKENKKKYDVIIAEGDRINNKRFFSFIHSLDIKVQLYAFSCSLKESIKRRQESGSNPSETFVKSTITKTKNMKLFGKELGFGLIEIKT